MPRSSQGKARAKDTSRVEARRRYRQQLRLEDDEPEVVEAEEPVPEAAPPASRSPFAMPDVRGDIRALPGVFRGRPLVLLPFGMLLVAFLLELARQGGMLPAGTVGDLAVLYIQLTLPPTALFVFFIGGFLAPRASWLVGGLLGAFDALLITLLLLLASQADLAAAGVTEVAAAEMEGMSAGVLTQLWGIAIVVGILAGGFASWYRSFLRNSQERARANRMAREREKAIQAREQARKDRATARQLRSAGRGRSS